jgi:hypothetical protein
LGCLSTGEVYRGYSNIASPDGRRIESVRSSP